jgi:beta-galactosidase
MVLCMTCISLAQSARQRELFDFDWRFIKGDPAGAEKPDFRAFSDARTVDLPHDWSIEGPWDAANPTGGPGGFFPAGVGWYRKTFTLPDAARDKKISIQFDGVYMNSDVWLNGEHLGKWPFGYSSFVYDLTPHVKFGEPNVLAVRVDNSQQPNSRWYSGSGIFRNVWLITTDPLHVAPWGTYVTIPKAAAESASVRVRTRIANERTGAQPVTLTSEIVDPDGKVVATASSDKNIAAGATDELDQTIEVNQPKRWSIESPTMYTLRSIVKAGGQVVDEYTTPIGIREIAYDVNKGFLLNGEPVKMKGVCLHHEAGSVGAAVPEGVWARRLQILKAMGCNAIRTSHNPPDPVFLDLCDRMGFVVMDEAFDEWTVRKPQIRFGYSDYFRDWYEKDLVNFIHRDRNHPSVVMWSAGNEIGEQRAAVGPEVLAKLMAVFHREDPTRPVTAGMDNIFTDRGEAPAAFTSLLDIKGYNYVDRWVGRRETYYADDRYNHPDWKFVGTESSSIGGTRGQYSLPPLPGAAAPEPAAAATVPGRRGGRGPGAFAGGGRGGSYATSMIRVEGLWKFIATHDYVIGDFMWTGIDYLGETGGQRKGAGSGQIDTAGFPKDSYYFYQSQWTAQPVLHLMPHWTWPSERVGQVIPVIAYTNCDSVELFVNGKSWGSKTLEFPRQGNAGAWNRYARPYTPGSTLDLHLSWDVPYAPGSIRAVGKRNGQVVAETEIKTAGNPAAIKLSVDRNRLAADARDVAHFTVQVVDANGVPVPNANPTITFDLKGPAKLIATDNGDLSDVLTPNNSKTRHAFNGMALAIIQSTRDAGKISVTASMEGAAPVTVDVESISAQP